MAFHWLGIKESHWMKNKESHWLNEKCVEKNKNCVCFLLKLLLEQQLSIQ